jgi:hypothetical protein
MVVKKLIEGGGHMKGTHTNPEVRKEQNPEVRKKQNPEVRKPSKEQNPEVRKPNKKQNLALRKKADRSGWNRSVRVQSDADILQDIQVRFETHGGEGFASPQKHEPRKRYCFAGTRPSFSSRTPSWD